MDSVVVTNEVIERRFDELVTPCKVYLKRLSSIPPNSSSKKCLFRDEAPQAAVIDLESDAESDLGPMSPLELTDQSSCENSPGNGLKDFQVVPETPSKESDIDDETSFVEETPQKDDIVNEKFNTPLGSLSKCIPIPKLHRRKSLSGMDSNRSLSPEIEKCKFIRHLDNFWSFEDVSKSTHDLCGATKARAALFQEEKNLKPTQEKVDKKFILTTKSFYGSSKTTNKSLEIDFKSIRGKCSKSLKKKNNISLNKIKLKRSVGVNRGVCHGIKKPKPKRQVDEKSMAFTAKPCSNVNETKENFNPQPKIIANTEMKILQSTSFPVNKKSNLVQTQNFSDFKKILQKKKSYTLNSDESLQECELDLSFNISRKSDDALENVNEKNNIDNLLKILEEDWADEEECNYEEITNRMKTHVSPTKTNVALKNLTMSPGSELSTMASSMNIEDVTKDSKDAKNVDTIKYYPLFLKGYNLNINENQNARKRKRSIGWQSCAKYRKMGNQYQIDAGQKIFGAIQCKDCGIIYHAGDPDDENAHLNYHNSYKILKFQGWKNENVIFKDAFTDCRIILVQPKDSNVHWKKVSEVLEMVDRDLGLSDTRLSFYRDKKIYLYVRDKNILGVLVAEQISSAYTMIPDLMDLNCCTTESCPAKCGVNVVWTSISHRRQGIATKLVDTLRMSFFYGYIMSVEDIAFSMPTPSGKAFAEKYTKTCNFKVYA